MARKVRFKMRSDIKRAFEAKDNTHLVDENMSVSFQVDGEWFIISIKDYKEIKKLLKIPNNATNKEFLRFACYPLDVKFTRDTDNNFINIVIERNN